MELYTRIVENIGWQMRQTDGGTVQLPRSSVGVDAPSPPTAFVVETELDDRLLSLERLTRAGFRVTVAETFALAKTLVVSQLPDILVTAVRLGSHNGLHLVMRAKAARSHLPALVLATEADAGLRQDAEALGATFVVTPIAERDFIAAVLQTVFRDEATSGVPIRPPFERRNTDRRAATAEAGEERRTIERRRPLPWLVPPRPATETTA